MVKSYIFILEDKAYLYKSQLCHKRDRNLLIKEFFNIKDTVNEEYGTLEFQPDLKPKLLNQVNNTYEARERLEQKILILPLNELIEVAKKMKLEEIKNIL